MSTILTNVENSSDYVLLLLRVESDDCRPWSSVGVSTVLEYNGSHKGINIIGATEIAKKLRYYINAYAV